mmetsp:Transcript_40376/g.38855  ORF Transcript_40376/g.38855 Transcript_40376/m.38855 type:complete len:93 (-) Transcript_40376:981-1259(-)
MKTLKSLKQVLEFTNTSNMTPLLIAAKYGKQEQAVALLKEGANPYVSCCLLNNPLHYAAINHQEDLIRTLLLSDAESGILKNERNSRNQKPE